MKPRLAINANVDVPTASIQYKPPARTVFGRIGIGGNKRWIKLAITCPARLALLASMIAVANDASATLIIFFVRDADITVAADSKASGANESLTACKIVQCGESGFVAMAGDVAYESMDEYVEVVSFVRAVCARGGSIVERADRYATVASTSVQRRVDSFINAKPGELRTGYIMSAAFFGFEGATPTIAVRHLRLDLPNPAVIVAGENCPSSGGRDCGILGGRGVLFLGEHDAAFAYWNSRPLFQLPSFAPDHLSDLIEHQSSITPKWVGGDIDIVRVTATGAKWMARKSECEDDAASQRSPGATPTR